MIVIDEFQDAPPEMQQILAEQTREAGAVYLKRAIARQRAARVLDVCAAFIPLRVENEEFGDLLEDFNRRINAGQHRLAYARLVTGVLWSAVNVIGYFMQNALGRRKTG